MNRTLYKKYDCDTAAWDLNATCRKFTPNTKARRKLRKKLRRKLRKTLDKALEPWYNKENEEERN